MTAPSPSPAGGRSASQIRAPGKALFPTVMLGSSLLVLQVAEGVFRGLGEPPSSRFEGLGRAWFYLSLVAWFWNYCREQEIPWLMDLGWFMVMAWPIVVPYYVLKREGVRGLGRLGLFAFAYLACWILSFAVSIWVRVLSGDG